MDFPSLTPRLQANVVKTRAARAATRLNRVRTRFLLFVFSTSANLQGRCLRHHAKTVLYRTKVEECPPARRQPPAPFSRTQAAVASACSRPASRLAIETIHPPRTATRPPAQPHRRSALHIDEETSRPPLHHAPSQTPRTSTPPSAATRRCTTRPAPAARDKTGSQYRPPARLSSNG